MPNWTRIPFPEPEIEPVAPPSSDVYQYRLELLRRSMKAAGYQALLVYGDRERFANLAFLTGYEPRFEESLLIVNFGPKGPPIGR